MLEASSTAKKTFNPIRSIVDKIKVEPNPEKKMISLSLGDPTVFGNLETAREVREAMKRVIVSGSNGYAPSSGMETARQSIANRYKSRFQVDYNFEDIIIASGCSGALDLAISALCGPGDFILLPKPGFTLYGTLAGSKGINVIPYELDSENNWEIKLDTVETILKINKEKIKAWLINNPSNPCGSVYSKDHLESCLKLAKMYNVPVISDEIYEDMVFSGSEYIPLARLSQESSHSDMKVPILTCSGLAKRFLVPGWRFGWVSVHEPLGSDLSEIRRGLFDLSTLLIGSCTLIQQALPEIFEKTPEFFYRNLNDTLEANAKYLTQELSAIDGLKVIKPQGTMYMLIGIEFDKFGDFGGRDNDDVIICEKLISEQSISVLPGSVQAR